MIHPLSRHDCPQAVEDGQIELVPDVNGLAVLSVQTGTELGDFFQDHLLHALLAKAEVPEI